MKIKYRGAVNLKSLEFKGKNGFKSCLKEEEFFLFVMNHVEGWFSVISYVILAAFKEISTADQNLCVINIFTNGSIFIASQNDSNALMGGGICV